MQTNDVSMNARVREEKGSRASRRLRRGGELPALLSGLGQDPLSLVVGETDFLTAHRAGAHLVSLDVAGEAIEALIRDVQLDAFGDKILHVDFDRVLRGQEIELEIRIEFFGEPAGADEGGVFQVLKNSIDVRCLPQNIPEMIEVDVRKLEIGDDIRVRDLPLPDGVALGEDVEADELIAMVSAQDIEEEEAEEVEPAEPEVLTAKKEEDD